MNCSEPNSGLQSNGDTQIFRHVGVSLIMERPMFQHHVYRK
ncbi:MAG: hypothetical protein JWR26_3827 [Pedosphaera sp.]|nr:hypothetical protein [Pedosphaera sp.]